MKIGEKIKALRLTQGNIKKSDLAVAVGIAESKISSYEKNLSRPPHQILLKIAEYFKVPPEFFFEDEKDSENNKKEDSKKESKSQISEKKDFSEINIVKSKISTKGQKNLNNIKVIKEKFNNKLSEIDSEVKNSQNKNNNMSENESDLIRNIPDTLNNNEQFQLIHNDLIKITSLLNKLIEIESGKPNFDNIKDIVRASSVIEANRYLKKGYVLLELFKDDKGQLGFTLGGK
jgi:transcriptional regulator with XRE-family HTH domain